MAVSAEPTDSTVGVHRQLEVSDGRRSLGEKEEMALSWAEGRASEEGLPLREKERAGKRQQKSLGEN